MKPVTGWRLINTSNGWQIARLGEPGYIASEYLGNREAQDAIHQLYEDAVRGAELRLNKATQ